MKEKTLLFMKEFQNLRKIILQLMLFVIKFFLTIASYQFSGNDWIFMNYGLFF